MHAHHILYVQQTSVTSGTDILKGFATCVMKAYIQSQCIHKVSNGLDIWKKQRKRVCHYTLIIFTHTPTLLTCGSPV